MHNIRFRSSRLTAIMVMAVSVTCLVAAALSQPAPSKTQIAITATGEKNSLSKGSEVWLLKAPGLDMTHPHPGWEVRYGNVLVSYGANAGAQLSWQTDPTNEKLVLHKHPFSGIVVVKINDEAARYDLYSPSDSTLEINLPERATGEQNPRP